MQGRKNSLSFERRQVLLSHYFEQTRQTKIWSVIQKQKTKIQDKHKLKFRHLKQNMLPLRVKQRTLYVCG